MTEGPSANAHLRLCGTRLNNRQGRCCRHQCNPPHRGLHGRKAFSVMLPSLLVTSQTRLELWWYCSITGSLVSGGAAGGGSRKTRNRLSTRSPHGQATAGLLHDSYRGPESSFISLDLSTLTSMVRTPCIEPRGPRAVCGDLAGSRHALCGMAERPSSPHTETPGSAPRSRESGLSDGGPWDARGATSPRQVEPAQPRCPRPENTGGVSLA